MTSLKSANLYVCTQICSLRMAVFVKVWQSLCFNVGTSISTYCLHTGTPKTTVCTLSSYRLASRFDKFLTKIILLGSPETSNLTSLNNSGTLNTPNT